MNILSLFSHFLHCLLEPQALASWVCGRAWSEDWLNLRLLPWECTQACESLSPSRDCPKGEALLYVPFVTLSWCEFHLAFLKEAVLEWCHFVISWIGVAGWVLPSQRHDFNVPERIFFALCLMSNSSAWKTFIAVCLSPSKLASQVCTASHKFQSLYIVLFSPGKKKCLNVCGAMTTNSQMWQFPHEKSGFAELWATQCFTCGDSSAP